ncbi:hypothetical protein H4R20_005416 [Coemansia guatemalensis]|uniref:Uncharacterized protein n=1 Tax=Coemansia guatemalensis TaxID=2761395 RepID=A0A9W8LS58_9FUNG|nr:hypothetical protein H4R20_005416 [Coemansia guatemalensis]
MNWDNTTKLASSNWLPVYYTPRSTQHSRSSSTSTVVDMISPFDAVRPQSPPATAVAAPSPSLATGPRISIKPPPTAPCSPVTQFKGGSLTPCLSPRRDSVLDYQPAHSDSEAIGPSPDKGLLEDLEHQSSEDDDEESCVFDMDSDWSQHSSSSPALVSTALAYGSTGKPKPWAIRPMGIYDSVRAQIRAIDDDDDEYYPS